MNSVPKIGFYTAVSLVIANMIGTGVFTSLGFQVVGISDGFSLMMLWLIGGIISLCGALVYSEIGARFPNSGGEYNYLSKIYHPSVGFLAGWVSATVGFSAPVAMAAMALSKYAGSIPGSVNSKVLAVFVIVFITVIHAIDLKSGSVFQRLFTLLKIIVVLLFVFFGFANGNQQAISVAPTDFSWKVIFSGGFAIALYWITYSYSGWNAASYMAGEIHHPKKNLPLALISGTLLVTLLYILLNYVFLISAPLTELRGQEDVGLVAAHYIFGSTLGRVMGIIISLLLVSAISAMTMAGPRVMQSMGKEVDGLRFLSKTNQRDVPYIAILLQAFIAIVLVLTSRFEFVLQFTSFSLNLFTFLTVSGLFFLPPGKELFSRSAASRLFLLYLPATLFLVFQLWILFFGFTLKTKESLLGMINLFVGFVFWIVAEFFYSKKKLI